MFNLFLLLAGFLLLIYGANWLVDGASSFAKKFNIPNIVIGLTIVAFGTSAPELVVNVFASFGNNSEIVLGNVLGSNIFNVFAILGISSIIYPLTVKTNTTWIEIPLSFLAALLVLVLAQDIFLNNYESNRIDKTDGIVLLCFFIIFLIYNLQIAKNSPLEEEIATKDYSKVKSLVLIIIGFLGLIIGGKAIVYSAVNIARLFSISERIIAITIISIGTSLPELATSLVAVKKKNVDIAIGNVVGSNIFNIFFILGLSSIIHPVVIQHDNLTDILVNILSGLLLFVFLFTGKGRRLDKWEGLIFILIYLFYISTLSI